MIHDVSQPVKVILFVSLPTDEEILSILRDIKDLGGLAYLATVADVSVRTLYRHIGSDAKKPAKLGGDTKHALIALFLELELLGGPPGAAKLSAAVRELERRAVILRATAGRSARGIDPDPARGSNER